MLQRLIAISSALLCAAAVSSGKTFAAQLHPQALDTENLLPAFDIEATPASHCEEADLPAPDAPSESLAQEQEVLPQASQSRLVAYFGDDAIQIDVVEDAQSAHLGTCADAAGGGAAIAGGGGSFQDVTEISQATKPSDDDDDDPIGGLLPDATDLSRIIGGSAVGTGGIICAIVCGGGDDGGSAPQALAPDAPSAPTDPTDPAIPVLPPDNVDPDPNPPVDPPDNVDSDPTPDDPVAVPEASDMALSILFGGLGLAGVLYKRQSKATDKLG